MHENKTILFDNVSEFSSKSEEGQEETEEKKEEECFHRPDIARENVKCGELSPQSEADQSHEKEYTYLILADGEHAKKHMVWTCDNAASDSETSVNTKKTSNTNPSKHVCDASYKSTDSPFFGSNPPKEFKPRIKFTPPLGRNIQFALPPGTVMTRQVSCHASDYSSMESEDSNEAFFDELEANRSQLDKFLDAIIDGLLPHHGLDTIFYDNGSGDYVSDFEDSSQEYYDRESLFQDIDEESVDEETMEGQRDFPCVVTSLLANEHLTDIRQGSVTIPHNDQVTRSFYTIDMIQAVAHQEHGGCDHISDPPGKKL